MVFAKRYFHWVLKFGLLAILINGCTAPTKKIQGDKIIYYPFAKDSFLIRINDLAEDAKAGDTIHFIYYGDQSLKSGQLMHEAIKKNEQQLQKGHYVFVGIAHFGSYRPRRRRDFIPPSVKTENGYKGVSNDYGQADSFYHFLVDKIKPVAENKYSGHAIKRSWIGHSLGGLFASYLLVNDDSLFENLYALSPALWIDDYHLLNYENSQQKRLVRTNKYIWISCGSRETINKIKNGVERINDTLALRKYPGINYSAKIYDGETHNSSVQPALDDIFKQFTDEQ